MVLLGSLVNGMSVVAGSLIGKILHNIPEGIKNTVMHAIGLAVLVLGLQMGLKSDHFLTIVISLVGGVVIGEWMALEERLNQLGIWIEKRIGLSNRSGSISQGFVTATLIFVIGAMGIIGALDSGIRGNHQVLFTKSILDGFTALILTTTLGIGVLFSAIPVFLYEGLIALLATQINHFVPKEVIDSFITEMTSVGGIMIFAIGLNILGLTKIKVANFLPSLLVTAILVVFYYFI
ncbi:MAG: DUF554 domain-containing protein [Bacillales bacterium]|nr:DUF554 domain-containing protein [Bacillales bacterium]